MQLNGYDTGAGVITPESWEEYVDRRAQEVGVAAGDTVFEIGCGAGAFLWVLHKKGFAVGGIDYSRSLIAAAREAMTDGTWRVGEAGEKIGTLKYDAVIANSVFHYFPDKEYAKHVLGTMLTAARQAVGIFDVPDERVSQLAREHRREILGKEEYDRRYRGLEHLAFDPQWFTDVSGPGWEVTHKSQDIENYGNNQYRFNIVMKRRP